MPNTPAGGGVQVGLTSLVQDPSDDRLFFGVVHAPHYRAAYKKVIVMLLLKQDDDQFEIVERRHMATLGPDNILRWRRQQP
jgi:hypothetical protein